MRVNIYGEELTYQNEIVHKEVDGRNFYGIRIFLESTPFLHQTKTDDDRSAVTFWVPWTAEKGNDFKKLETILAAAFDRASELRMDGKQI